MNITLSLSSDPATDTNDDDNNDNDSDDNDDAGKPNHRPLDTPLTAFSLGSGSNYVESDKDDGSPCQRRSGEDHSGMDDDAQFAEDNVSEPDPSSPTRSHTASSKCQGKGKQQSTSSGPVPLEGIQAAQALGVRTMEQADILANVYATSQRTILQLANLTLKESRGQNIYNQHKEWYTNHFPKANGGMLLYYTL